MKHVFLILSIFYVLPQWSISQTTIKNKQEISGIWNEKGSPYYVEGEAIVPEGKTLTIKEGAVIYFKIGWNADYLTPDFNMGMIRVNGSLIAKGSDFNPISFYRKGGEGYWGCVYFSSTSKNNVLKYCRFENAAHVVNAEKGINAVAACSFEKSKATVENCLFINNLSCGIACLDGALAEINHTTFIGNNYGVAASGQPNPVVTNCIFWNNKAGSIYVENEGKPNVSYSLLQESAVPAEITDGGHNLINTNPKFKNQLFYALDSSSPCQKSGKDGSYMGWKPFSN